jgi:hypothetical protein
MVLTMTSSPWMIRGTAKNRFINQLTRTTVANRGRRRSERLQTRFTDVAVTPRTSRSTPGSPGEPPRSPLNDGGVAGAKRLFAPRHARPVKPLGSDPIGGGRDSPLTYRAACYRHDCSTVARITSAAAGIGSTCADERFFRGVEPGAQPQSRRRRLANVRRLLSGSTLQTCRNILVGLP